VKVVVKVTVRGSGEGWKRKVTSSPPEVRGWKKVLKEVMVVVGGEGVVVVVVPLLLGGMVRYSSSGLIETMRS